MNATECLDKTTCLSIPAGVDNLPQKGKITRPSARKPPRPPAAPGKSSVANSPPKPTTPTPSPLTLTIITSRQPRVLTKKFKVDAHRDLVKTSSAQLVDGNARQIQVANLKEFAELLDALEASQALVYGLAKGHESARIVSNERHALYPDAITRTKDYFGYAQRPGVMMLDYDPAPGGTLKPEQWIRVIRNTAPCLADALMLWRPSASSCISRDDGTELAGIEGQRLYLPVRNAALIPEAGNALNDLLWAGGEGWVEIGKAGQALMRTLVDTAVWSPERLDFAGPPVLAPGLMRTSTRSAISGSASQWLNLRDLFDAATPAVRERARQRREAARVAMKPQLKTARDQWIEEQAPRIAEQRGQSLEVVRDYLNRAAESAILEEDFVLHCADGTQVTVGEMLANPAKWHNKRFCDPLEPGYRNDKRIAWANMRSGGMPYLYSHAHGGQRYSLLRTRPRIVLQSGQRAQILDLALEALRERNELYDYGESKTLVRVTPDGTLVPVQSDWLNDYLDRAIVFTTQHSIKGEVREELSNAPVWLGKRIDAKTGERGFPQFDAVVTAPTLRRDGSVISDPGYDEHARLLYLNDAGVECQVPEYPTLEEAQQALTTLWHPVHLFPFVDTVDRGVILAAMLTACIRATLPTAPGFGINAPTAGSGKTLLAKAIGVLTMGKEPAISPPADNRDDEARKRLFAVLYEGSKVLLWDNVRDPLGNTALDAFLTAASFSDRILGQSQMVTLPNRSLFLVTGNGLRLVGDTCRRILMANLDAKVEQPYSREFQFCPLEYVISHRQKLVMAALTLIRANIAADRPRLGAGRTASFELWDDLVRQAVCWIASWDDRFSDPLLATERAFEVDPETSKLIALLEAWDLVYQDKPTTTAQVIFDSDIEELARKNEPFPNKMALHVAVEEIALYSGKLNPRVLGRWIEKRVERRLNGLRLVRGTKIRGNQTWLVLRDTVTIPPASKPELAGKQTKKSGSR